MGLKGRAAALLIGVVCSLSFLSTSAFGADLLKVVQQTKPFLKSIKETPYNYEYLVEGLRSIHALRFNKGQANHYEPFWNRLNLQDSLGDRAKRLKRVSELSPLQLGVLAHEAFHPFYSNKIKSDPKYKGYKKFMANRADVLYKKHPRKKRDVALEEAYASFLDSLFSGYKTIEKILRSESYKADCKSAIELTEKFWKSAWKSTTNGYYYRDSISEYWFDQYKGLRILTTKGRVAYKRYLNRDRAVYVKEGIQAIDKKWIVRNILKGKMSPSWQETFSDYACVKAVSKTKLARAN